MEDGGAITRMKAYLNTRTGLLTAVAGGTQAVRRIEGKRGDVLLLEVVPDAVIAGAVGIFAAKATYAGGVVVLDSTWTAPVVEGAGYLFEVSLNTVELDALFTDETDEAALLAEVTWTLDGVVRSTQTLSLVVARDVWRGDEPNPSEAGNLLATQGEAEAGTVNDRWMSPLRVAQAMAAARESVRLEAPDGGVWEVRITNDGQLERTKL